MKPIAVVTGAGSGIGRAIAMELASAGSFTALADIDAASAHQTQQLIEAQGGSSQAYTVDVADPTSVEQFARELAKHHGNVTTLVNNAAIQVNASVENTSYDEWRRVVDVNFGGVFLCSKHFLAQLRETRGNIVNVSSVNAFFAERGCAVYAATKAAIIGLTKAMAIDHGREGIRVNCVCPGYVDTGLAAGYFESRADPQAARRAAGALHALGRIADAAEIARAVRFLASADASFITGTQLVVDGGMTCGLPG